MFDVAILDTPTLLAPRLAQVSASSPAGVDVTRYLVACLIVIGLLCIGAWFLARMGRGGVAARGRKRSLQVVDMLPLGRKQRLCVVRAYDRTFVLGLGEREVSMVGELDNEDDLAAQALLENGANDAKETRSFASLVKGAIGTASSIVDAARNERSSADRRATAAPNVATSASGQATNEASAHAAGHPTEHAEEQSVEKRAADAAREALMAILDERREAQAARTNEQPRRRKVRRPAGAAPANGASAKSGGSNGSGSSAKRGGAKNTARTAEGGEAPRRRPATKASATAARTARSADSNAAARSSAPQPSSSERQQDAAGTWVG